MYKILILFLSVIFYTTTNFAQNATTFGIKASLNYNSNGKLITQEYPYSLVFVDKSTGRIGYSVGLWARKSFLTSPVFFTVRTSIYSNKEYI